MTLTPVPPIVELSDFSSGDQPDVEDSALPQTAVRHAVNLLPDVGSGTPQVRKGYKRLVSALTSGYRVDSLFQYDRVAGTTKGKYLVAVASTDGNEGVTADLVQVWAVNLSALTATKVSPGGKVWASSDARHWGQTINQTFYGGGPGDPLYSWNPDDGWKDHPSIQDFKTIVDTTDPTLATQHASNYAFKKGDKVLYLDPFSSTTQAYSASRGIRHSPWKDGKDYQRGDKVSFKWTSPTSKTYWRTWKAKKTHTAAVGNKPGSGAGLWIAIELALPRDEDGQVTKDWDLIPEAAFTNVAAWHADRLFLRWDNEGPTGKTRVQYSAPSKPKKGDDLAVFEWDAKDFALSTIKGAVKNDEGEGGGWLPDQPEEITALHPYGYYLCVFMRHQARVLVGTDENSWLFRDLASVGCVGPRAVCTHEGLVYFLSDQGFYQTDGSTSQEVPGAHVVRDFLRNAVDWEDSTKPDGVTVFSYGGFVWVSLPTGKGRTPDTTLVYDPQAKSFWPLDIGLQAACVARIGGTDQLFFSKSVRKGTYAAAVFAWTGTPRRSQSTRISGGTAHNLFSNPSFEPTTGQTIAQADADAGWDSRDEGGNLDPQKQVVHHHKSVEAARRGRLGMVVTNTRIGVELFSYAGLTQSFADIDATSHTVSAYFRRPEWKKHPKLDYSMVRLYVGGVLSSGVHTFTKVGKGWWRVSATYTGSLTSRAHGFVLGPKRTLQVEQAACDKGALSPYFDGDGGDDPGEVSGGGLPFVFEYDHPDVQESPSDDTGSSTYASDSIAWGMRTAWLPFSVLRQDRRIRRVWAVVRGDLTVTLRGYPDYTDDPAFEQETTPSVQTPSYVEGRSMPDSYAVSIGVEGIGAPAAVLGVAIHTEPRRNRYHS